MKSWIIALSLLLASCATPAPKPVPTMPAPPAQVAISRLKWFGYWMDAGKATGDHANTIDFLWPDDVFVANTDANWNTLIANANTAVASGRKLIVWTPFFRYSNGYYFAEDGLAKWNARKESLRPLLPNIIAFYLMDEPDISAGANLQPGQVGNPNLYSPLMKQAVDVIRGDFPEAPVAFNYGDFRGDYVVPDWVTWVGLESYGKDLSTFGALKLLETKTNQIVVMPQATINPTAVPTTTDAVVAQWASDQYAYAKTDSHIIGLRAFMWCIDRYQKCDDSAPDYMVGGDMMPLTRAAFLKIGQAIAHP